MHKDEIKNLEHDENFDFNALMKTMIHSEVIEEDRPANKSQG